MAAPGQVSLASASQPSYTMIVFRMMAKMQARLWGWGAALAGALLAAGASAWPAGAPVAAPAQGSSGSSFVVAPGVLVTNAHVALRCRAQNLPLRVDGQPGPWRVAVLDAEADLALLQGPPGVVPVLPLSTARRLPRGTQVLALGYPSDDSAPRLSGRLRAARGQVLRATLTVHDPASGSAASFVATDPQGRELEPSWEDGLRYFGEDRAGKLRWRLEIDAPAAGGSSGGPVLDAAGQVVGVVYAGGRGLTAAIPLEDLRALLARAGITPLLRPGARMADWESVEAEAARATLRIGC